MEKIVEVTNRNGGWTGYTVPDLNITRNFKPGETKKIPFEELWSLQSVPGGDFILHNCLIINDTDALSQLNMENLEPEYFYTEAEVRELLNSGSLEQLEDCLNFAPDGVIDLVKTIAVQTELPDTRKRKLIYEKTGVNIDTAINLNNMMAEEDAPAEDSVKVRKAAPISSEGTTTRKAATPKYNVVKKN